MEVASLREFKDAILEYSVLNGREVFFEKNDKDRVRMKCKQEYDFLALVSKGKSKVTAGNSKRGRPPKGKKTAEQGNAQPEPTGTEQGTAKKYTTSCLCSRETS
ncbi:Transposase, MuDR, plant [Sesbania bispinosa]|nr:Transposase, MuDR, plant [Sesbania bispinosa]